MKKTLVISVLLLIVFPTAILSLLAGLNLRHWEAVLRQRLESNAGAVLDAAARRVQTLLDGEVEQARSTLVSTLGAGLPLRNVSTAARQFEAAHPLARTVYVFRDPWGFIWPEEAEGERAGADTGPPSGREDEDRVLLTTVLRREAVSAASLVSPLVFAAGDDTYCFKRLELRSDIYAGFSIDPEAFDRELWSILNDLSGEDFRLAADSGDAREAELVLRDSLSPGAPNTLPAEDRASVLAQRRLLPPFDGIALSARPAHPGPAVRAGLTQARLSAWGILLLVTGVLAGIGIVLHEVANEIRTARSRSDFVIGISHDLRTPISSMRLMAESLLLGYVVDPDKKALFLRAMVQESERLSQLIERVLYFVRFGQKAFAFHMKPLDAADVVREAIHTFAIGHLGADALEPETSEAGAPTPPEEPPAGDGTQVIRIRKKLTFGLRVEPGLPRVRGDAGALRQVILNLLDNAEKYGGTASEADGPIRVDVALNQEQRLSFRKRLKRWVVLGVTDYGPGIAANEQRRIFRQFYRSAQARQGHASGVGLGLALCRHIVKTHGGTIGVRSAPGKGSVFMVRLPAMERDAT